MGHRHRHCFFARKTETRLDPSKQQLTRLVSFKNNGLPFAKQTVQGSLYCRLLSILLLLSCSFDRFSHSPCSFPSSSCPCPSCSSFPSSCSFLVLVLVFGLVLASATSFNDAMSPRWMTLSLLLSVCVVSGTHGSQLPSIGAVENGSLVLETAKEATVLINGEDLSELFAVVSELKTFKAAASSTIAELQASESTLLSAITELQSSNSAALAALSQLQASESTTRSSLQTLKQFDCLTPLEPFSFTTMAGFEWEHFIIGGTHYLAVANFNDKIKYEVESQIIRWSPNVTEFLVVQSISTIGAHDWTHFVMDGVHYLALANYLDDNGSYQVASQLYSWNFATSQFDLQQNIFTKGAFDWEYFSIDGDHYLVVANYYDGGSYQVNSQIYRWDADTSLFEPFQDIATNAGRDWEYFVIDDSHYLAIASASSEVFKWNRDTKQFDSMQVLLSASASACKHFVIDEMHYLGVAIYTDGNSYEVNSHIFEWNAISQQFTSVQQIPTKGAQAMEYFAVSDGQYLVVGNQRDDSKNYVIDSVVLQWNRDVRRFEEFQFFPTSGVSGLTHFNMDGVDHLAIANQLDGFNRIISSQILSWNGCRF
eukprot:m.86166 g.86166  ORF g.86166 m.86166 type:complete len:595 (-) comp14455_c0_seq2:33-1817(-)